MKPKIVHPGNAVNYCVQVVCNEHTLQLVRRSYG